MSTATDVHVYAMYWHGSESAPLALDALREMVAEDLPMAKDITVERADEELNNYYVQFFVEVPAGATDDEISALLAAIASASTLGITDIERPPAGERQDR